ncbi:MAG: aspartate/tyrosine/aromatic aminotransferase, partial [Planctomycetales bacterium]|nr:aspartate/tyrosine/aromatic aminotransferase [Planctomycetales bacterium]
MFQSLQPAPPDPILGITEAFRADPRPEKINLSVGVFKDDAGATPALRCVAEAEQQLLAGVADRGYLGIDGLASYNEQVRQLLLGSDVQRAATAQTPGGTGALRVAADFIHAVAPNAAIHCSSPTWGNHLKVFAAAGLDVHNYAYADARQRTLDFDAMRQALDEMKAGDVVCLHACCHNPTGIDPTAEQWAEIAALLAERSLVPLIDIAYQGFGDGLEQDVAGLREVVARCPEALICSSFSKNFSLYGERVGAVTVVTDGAAASATAMSHVKSCIRTNYSNPPRHGASVVAQVLGDERLRGMWVDELAEMRQRIKTLRDSFVTGMAAAAPDFDFSFIREQRGMFSNSGLTPLQVDQLRND